MRTGDKKQFIDKDLLERMIKLRRQGLAETSLALLFGADVSTIRYHLRKYYITHPPQVYTIERIVMAVLPHGEDSKWKIINGERFSNGLSYKEYLVRAKLSP